MPDPVTIGTALSIGGSIASGISGIAGNKAAKRAAREQSELTYATRMEEMRRAEKQWEYDVGRAKAAGFASGTQVKSGGSTKAVINAMEREFVADMRWREFAAEKERKAIKRGVGGSNLGVLAGTAANIGSVLMGMK